MDDTAKYVIRAEISADGVIERSDVVGAVFGQTEGLLGDDLDISGLQQAGRLGRVDVTLQSTGGSSRGELSIESSADRVQTAVLAAALETIERIGPCVATVEILDIEDARAAARKSVVERASELLADGFDDTGLARGELIRTVRENARIADIISFDGLPAGPAVETGEAIIVVEGRADVRRLLQIGINNAIAVEGTGVPEPLSDLTSDRRTTAFLDGDRGGTLILRELTQMADIGHVARAPAGRSVEALTREEILEALREKTPIEMALKSLGPDSTQQPETTETPASAPPGSESSAPGASLDTDGGSASENAGAHSSERSAQQPEPSTTDTPETPEPATPTTLAEHTETIIDGNTETICLLDADWNVVHSSDVSEAVTLLEDGGETANAAVLDGTVTQAILDVAAQYGVGHVIGAERGAFTKQPTAVRVRTPAEMD